MGIENRRKFFTEFARERGFDPSVPQNWKNVTKAEVIAKMVKFIPFLFSWFFLACFLSSALSVSGSSVIFMPYIFGLSQRVLARCLGLETHLRQH